MKRRGAVCCFLFILAVSLSIVPFNTDADINVVREVVIAPKKGRAGANIGPVNKSVNVSMRKSDVEIRIGPVPNSVDEPLDIAVRARFTMKNESARSLALTVGFPISDSAYSAFELQEFTVTSNGTPRSVFNRVTGYPHRLKHVYVSGPDKEGHKRLPDYADAPDDPGVPKGTTARNIFGDELIGKESFHNLMIWKETFDPDQVSIIDVAYEIAVPLQKNRVKTKKIEASYKGIWPQEANNVPASFLESIPENMELYFFDYYLTSGASWKETIGEEIITLKLHKSWQGHTLFSSYGEKVDCAGPFEKEGDETTYVYVLKDAEPTENLYFGLARP